MKYLFILLISISTVNASEILDDYYAEYSNYEKEEVIIYIDDKVITKPITLDQYFKEYIND